MLDVANVKVNYGDIPVLRRIDLTVTNSEIVSLIGSNGMGKTTLIRAISGLVVAQGGTMTFDGESITGKAPRNIVSMGISQVPEGRKLFLGMTVKENLLMGAYTRKDQGRIQEDLQKVFDLFPRLQERQNQTAGTLSGGEQQMCAIGRGMMSRPKLLMIDEMSLGLAPVLVDSLIAVIHEINREGTSILLVEQDVLIALENSDRCYVMEGGEIVQSGGSKDLLDDPEIKTSYLGM